MNLLTIDNISKQYSERLLFDGASLLINEGDRLGLIGVNGSGKSTLLKITAGLEAPDAGSVSAPGGVRIEYLPQEPPLQDALTVLETIFRSDSPQMRLLRTYEQATARLEQQPDDAKAQEALHTLNAEMDRADGWVAEANAKAILTRLGVTNFDDQVGTLSGGQRKRVALARALIDRADLLILDEPTNHIDAATVAWLEEYLATTPGALLMVTHDRYFLDRVVNRIVELDRRQLVSYPGNYTQFLEARAQRHERLAEAEDKRHNLLRRELEWLRRQPMARGTKQKARKQRVEELMEIEHDSGAGRVAIALASRRLGGKVLTAQKLVKRFGDTAVLSGIDLHLEPGDRIGVIGPNGAGKSTLLDILAGVLPPDSGAVRWGDTVQIGYYDQRSIELKDGLRLIEFIENEAPLIRTKDGDHVEAAQMLEWFLFPRSMQYARIGSLSGGERRRLYLLRTLIHQPNVLLLDEPTNDLDIETLAVLEEFLDHFAGALIAVSHDRYFLDRTVDFLVSMEDGRLGPRYPSPYTLFARLQEEARADATPAAHVAPTPTPERRKTQPARLTWKEQREVESLETEIAALETRKLWLLDEINQIGDNYQRLQDLSIQVTALDQTLETAMERWFELSAKAES
ncbi:ABC-F family ATP-binding cassette domain-containing protein [Caldilinea sp.]|uniref:ABC-F family ATP-binding cassette domain-containing protein n=1 Tax=Caldilinea sp. TaxID=2293560 RepID=UPI002B9769E0|nr:ABC-F family ATP-binding cassette domain-containing protein [Caldilinea sp.]